MRRLESGLYGVCDLFLFHNFKSYFFESNVADKSMQIIIRLKNLPFF